MPSRNITIMLTFVTALAACQKKIDVTGMPDAQTMDYFMNNPAIAKATSAKCHDFQSKDYSKMTSIEQNRWQNSTDGINCKNAGEALGLIIIIERQRALKEANRKYQ